MKQKSGQVHKVVHRPGEGYVVDMIVAAGEGDSVTGTLDLGSLPVPDRRYVAEAIGLQVNDNQVKLLFGQRHVVGDDWLSLLVVNMSFESVNQLLNAAPPSFMDQYANYAKNVAPAVLTEFASKAEQTVLVTASIILAGYSGTNGCMDFYYASPFAMQQLAVFKKLSVEPVVRVNLPSSMVFAIIQGLRDASARFPKLQGTLKS